MLLHFLSLSTTVWRKFRKQADRGVGGCCGCNMLNQCVLSLSKTNRKQKLHRYLNSKFSAKISVWIFGWSCLGQVYDLQFVWQTLCYVRITWSLTCGLCIITMVTWWDRYHVRVVAWWDNIPPYIIYMHNNYHYSWDVLLVIVSLPLRII